MTTMNDGESNGGEKEERVASTLGTMVIVMIGWGDVLVRGVAWCFGLVLHSLPGVFCDIKTHG